MDFRAHNRVPRSPPRFQVQCVGQGLGVGKRARPTLPARLDGARFGLQVFQYRKHRMPGRARSPGSSWRSQQACRESGPIQVRCCRSPRSHNDDFRCCRFCRKRTSMAWVSQGKRSQAILAIFVDQARLPIDVALLLPRGSNGSRTCRRGCRVHSRGFRVCKVPSPGLLLELRLLSLPCVVIDEVGVGSAVCLPNPWGILTRRPPRVHSGVGEPIVTTGAAWRMPQDLHGAARPCPCLGPWWGRREVRPHATIAKSPHAHVLQGLQASIANLW